MQYLLTEEEYAEFQAIKVPQVAEQQRKSSFEQEARFVFEHSERQLIADPSTMGRESVVFRIELDRIPPNMRNYLRNLTER